MRQTLKLHPDSTCDAIARIDVEVARPRPDVLTLQYQVTGKIKDIRLAPVATPTRTDELWRTTCFETFVCIGHGVGYHEFNFAPSTQWAAYLFTAYRDGMSAPSEIRAPRIGVEATAEAFNLKAELDIGPPVAAPWRLGLSAVVEETNGRKSYWALAHPPGKPDFHHAIAFAHELKAPPA